MLAESLLPFKTDVYRSRVRTQTYLVLLVCRWEFASQLELSNSPYLLPLWLLFFFSNSATLSSLFLNVFLARHFLSLVTPSEWACSGNEALTVHSQWLQTNQLTLMWRGDDGGMDIWGQSVFPQLFFCLWTCTSCENVKLFSEFKKKVISIFNHTWIWHLDWREVCFFVSR